MFGFSYTEGGPWNDDGIKAITKFLDRIERLAAKLNATENGEYSEIGKDEKDLLYATNYAIKCVDRDLDAFSFNTAVARLMELVNAFYKYDGLTGTKNIKLFKECFDKFILLLAPCAPHFAEEIHEASVNKNSVFTREFPVCDESALVLDEIEVAVQINSKMRAKLFVPPSCDEQTARELIFKDEKLAAELAGKEIKKLIIIPKRLINVIV